MSIEINEIFQNLIKIPFIKNTESDADLLFEESGMQIKLTNKFGLEIDSWKNSSNKQNLFESIKKASRNMHKLNTYEN